MKCSTCNGPMTPMLFSWFCPKDCDKPRERPARQTVPGIGGPLMEPDGGQPWTIPARKPYDAIPGIPSGIPIKMNAKGQMYFDYNGKRFTWNPLGHWEWQQP